MVLNPQIARILLEHNINRDLGLLALLGLYYGIDIEKIYSEETIKAINLTKIFDKDYRTNSLTWNIPLFEGTEVAFGWIAEWMKPFGQINPERRGNLSEVVPRMKKFFAENPDVRKEDVYKARDAYFKTLTNPQYMMEPHYFITKGTGIQKTSTLLKWVTNTRDSNNTTNQKGRVIS